MKTTAIALSIFSMIALGGCGNRQTAATDTSSTNTPAVAQSSNATADPEQLGRIGAQIKKHPKEADRILSEHGMNTMSFEKAIRTVSSDPAASRKYRDAYKRAGA